MADPLGKCECINQFNKNVIIEALEKRYNGLFKDIYEYTRDKEKLGDKPVHEIEIISNKIHREYIREVIDIVLNTPVCEQDD